MKYLFKIYMTAIFTIAFLSIHSQRIIEADLTEIINAAVTESPSKLLAKTRLSNEYWQYINFNSTFKPQLSFDATLPFLSRSIDAIPLPDGSEAFVNRSFMRNNVGISLRQVIPQTGGTVFVNTGLSRIDLFETNAQDYSRSYLSTPISIGFNQPIFQFNRFKWMRQITEIEYEQSKQQYIEETEEIIYDAVNLYFDLYISKLDLEQALRNKTYLDSISEVADGRFEVGRISETEMLQIRLSAKNANAQVNAIELDVQNKNEQLRNYLGVKEEIQFELDIPQNIPSYDIEMETALRQAEQNRSRTAEFRLRLLNAEMDLDETVKSSGVRLSLNGSFGLTQSANNLGDAYVDLLDQETVTLSLSVPIADWGRRQSQREIARSNLELEQLQVEQDRITFQREIIVNVEQFNLKKRQLALAEESFDIATQRLNIAKSRYGIGKIDVTNLNIAIQEHENARQAFYAALWDLRRAHHEIRLLTLYDFEVNLPITVE
ncbi:MAG: TolC family protein [Saprospiraceae bacterium]|nr:TolC family protein [Saprospiraceae bacterium]